MSIASTPVHDSHPQDDGLTLGALMGTLKKRRRTIAAATVLAGMVGLGIALVVPPWYTARTVILPPQQQGSAAASALSSLGALSGLAAANIKSPAEQYVAFMTSMNVTDRIIDRFDLMKVYDEQFRIETHKRLARNVAIIANKNDGLISIEVDDHDPKRAADMANAFVDGLRQLTNNLAVTEAQQRRKFFEIKLAETKDKLTQAQEALQGSGYSAGSLKVEPKAAAESYARLQAEAAAAEVKLQTLRSGLADSAAAVVQQRATLDALRAQLSKEESQSPADTARGQDYVSKLREFQYEQTLFDLFARQYESARLDESREGALIQVVDTATVPEKKSKPSRALIVLGSAFAGLLLSSLWIVVRRSRTPG